MQKPNYLKAVWQALVFSIRSKLIIGFLILSLIVLGFHKMGALDIKRDLLHPDNYYEAYSFSSPNVVAQLSSNNKTLLATCEPMGASDHSHCGVGIALEEGWPEQGYKVSDYHTIEIEIEIQSSVHEPRTRTSFRNFDPVYSIEEDDVSLKFNSISYAPSKYPGKIRVPLKSFQVESWWVEQRKIEFEHAHLDFNNVAQVEFVTDTLSAQDTTMLVVKTAILHGELISEKVLLWTLAGISLLVSCLLVALQHSHLHRISRTDELTGEKNRRGLTEWVTKILATTGADTKLTMFYFDLDDFKKVNDTRGHLCGDELLRRFCDLIKNELEISRTNRIPHRLGRISGDEFAVIFHGLPKNKVLAIANGITYATRTPLRLSCGKIKVNFSLGIASSDETTKSFDSLLSRADAAMYYVKKRSKGAYKIFDTHVIQDILSRKVIAEKLTRALQKEEFKLVFMPIVDIRSLKISSCEVLLRCTSEELSGIGPDQFIPAAEQYDLIDKIDTWVFENALITAAHFSKKYPYENVMFAINISASQIHNLKFLDGVKKLIKKYKVETSKIELEITETAFVDINDDAIANLKEYKKLGFKLSLDDFGTGYTAFNQLNSFPVDCLKIDRSFTNKVTHSSDPVVMVNAILSIAQSYGLKTTAEGIEHKYQLEYMRANGCDHAQGYYFSKPLPYEEFLTYFTLKNSASA